MAIGSNAAHEQVDASCSLHIVVSRPISNNAIFLEKSSWRFIQYDMSELSEELGELFGSFAMENAEDPGDHLELDGFQFAFLRLFRRVEPI
jgi:hypothetical protein